MMFFVVTLLLTASDRLRAEFDYSFDEHNHFRFDGFGTLAFGTSDSDDLGLTRDTGQHHPYRKGKVEWRVDSSLGGQLFFKHKDWLNIVSQFVLRDRDDNGFEEILQYAFVALHPSPNWTVRLGRNPHDMYFLSDTQNVGFSHTWLRPAKGSYNEMLLDYYDGLELTYRNHTSDGMFSVKAFYGEIDAMIDTYSLPVTVSFSYEPFYGIKFTYENNALRTVLSYQQGKVTRPSGFLDTISKAWASIPDSVYHGSNTLADFYNFKNDDTTILSGGLFYDIGKINVQAEFSSWEMEGIAGLQMHAGYLGLAYQLPKGVKPFIRVARLYSPVSKLGYDYDTLDTLPESVRSLAALFLGSYYDIQANHVNTSIGLRWDFLRNMALKAQWDHFDAKENAVYMLSRLTPNSSKGGRFNLFSVSLDFVF